VCTLARLHATRLAANCFTPVRRARAVLKGNEIQRAMRLTRLRPVVNDIFTLTSNHDPGKSMNRHFALKLAALVLPIALAACGGGGDYDSTGSGSGSGNGGGNGGGGSALPTISGTVSGLNETGLVLTNGTDSVTLPAGATAFAFSASVASGAAYQVAVGSQPLWQNCSVTNGSGTMGASSVTNVAIACAQSIHITTVADSSATTFTSPVGVVVDGNGNTYVTEPFQHRLRKVAADGTVTTIGTGVSGADDGDLATASFNRPVGLAVDAAGNVFVADQGNHKVRKIATDGTVSTVAGDGTTTVFSYPTAVALDAAGNIFVADQGHHRIAKVAPDGTVSTLAGSGTAGEADGAGVAAQFNNPYALAIDGGTLYVVEYGKNRIRKVAADGTVSTLAGAGAAGFADGPGAQATFTQPIALTVREGNVYVVDGALPESFYGDRIRRIKPDGTVSTFMPAWAEGDPCCYDGRLGLGTIRMPSGLAVDAAGDLVVTQMGDNSGVRKIGRAEPEVSTLAVIPGGVRGAGPSDVVVDHNGNYYASVGATVYKLSPDGTLTKIGTGVGGYADGPAAEAQFEDVNALAVDAVGNVFVAEDGNRIRKIAPDGTVSTIAGTGVSGFTDGPAASAQFSYPTGIAVDGSGNVFVGDTDNYRIRKITPDGNVTTLAGDGTYGTADGAGATAQFTYPGGLAIDGSGNVLVADYDAGGVRKVAPDGTVSTAKPTVTTYGSFFADDVAVDANGNVYASNDDDGRIYRFGADGAVVIFAGAEGGGNADGTRKSARLGSYVGGLTVDSRGNLVAADTNNNTIRKVSTAPGTMPDMPRAGPRGKVAPSGTATSSTTLRHGPGALGATRPLRSTAR
jgi:trimeric autotransporter adhesin